MMTGAASSGRMIAVYQRPCSARMTALALLRASISAKTAARATSTACAPCALAAGELGLIRVEEAVDDRRGEKLCEPLQHGGFPFPTVSVSSPRGVPRDSKSAFTRVCDALCVAGGPRGGDPSSS